MIKYMSLDGKIYKVIVDEIIVKQLYASTEDGEYLVIPVSEEELCDSFEQCEEKFRKRGYEYKNGQLLKESYNQSTCR